MTATILQELIDLLRLIKDEHYTQQSTLLSGASIGQHVRHTIEMYQCLLSGYKTLEVDYSKRKRDIVIESSSDYAVQCLIDILSQVKKADKPITLMNDGYCYTSSFYREVFYCDEHCIHHMALIKIGVNEIGGYQLSHSFGVAPSTIKFRQQQCVQ